MTHRTLAPFALVALALTLGLAIPAAATTIVPVSDEDLALSSQVIVEGRVVAADGSWDAERSAVFTYVTFDVTRVLKGDVAVGRIVIKQRGGAAADGLTVVFGAPTWEPGTDMLLYLTQNEDGTLRVAHLSLGSFHVVADAAGRRFVVRAAAGEHVEVLGAGRIAERAPYDEHVDRLFATLATNPETAPALPVRTVPAEFKPAAKGKGGATDFGFLSVNARWFEPDSGQPVRFKVNPHRAPTASSGVGEVEAAAAAWSSVPGSSLRVEIAGSTSACGLTADGTSAISFDDCGGRFDPPVNCTGVVGLGGVSQATPSQTRSIGGRTFSRILDGDVAINPGFECLLSNPAVLSEVLAHEMGHALGFGHSSERLSESNAKLEDATMFFAIHNDGRGAALREDDEDAARFLYRGQASTEPLEIVTDTLPEAKVGAAYAFDLRATGTAPFTWSVVSGSLLDGLTLSAGGRISGTCPAEGAAVVTVRVRDAANFERTRELAMQAAPTPAPFVVRAAFKQSTGKLVISALNVDASATIVVNGTAVSSARPVKFKSAKGTLVVTGIQSELNVLTSAANTLVVVVGGRESNAVSF